MATAPYRYRPEGSQEVTGPGTTAVAYVSETNGAGYAIGYRGKSGKSAFNYRFRSVEQRDRFVAEWMRNEAIKEQGRAERKATEKAARAAFVTSFKVGDILTCSWGYEQTNVDFYEVVEVTGRASIVMREIGQTKTYSQSMAGKCMPTPGAFIGEPMRKRVAVGDRVTMTTYSSAHRWDGRESFWSSYG